MERKIAIISDIHGNSHALQAVLKDIARRKVEMVINLGDSLYGPLDPLGTIELLMNKEMIHIKGNCDRILWEPIQEESTTLTFVRNQLTNHHIDWLKQHPAQFIIDDMLFCHGTPTSDEMYLLEEMNEYGAVLKNEKNIMDQLQNIEQKIIVCGHTHIPRVVHLVNGKIVINPGSVGLPAYKDELPIMHKMESGTPHAKYVVIEEVLGEWIIEQISVPYNWEEAAKLAVQQGRYDWAQALKTGKIE
ncbi:TPA: metallophosphoesterase family protein [Bacillus cereus]|uniref:Phosphoesterase n=1 Tax=Bacillus cereus TaxID=1396 RepID=A0A1D3NLA7_BACCE|nr:MULTISPECIES: YfcE family phosphodiesterase [Bacillus]MCP1179814.1 metallophosphatase family protein [Bacillus sp. 1663tsa1]MCP1282060.1 metallophosphatase family protein [Bacillus sp. S0635]MCQ6346366.1 metallophosphatase family protein [Bacillus cereus]MCU5462750.1 metallophosphatase family protein [Bacillus cereus]MCU5751321.1 metallophosphatase family protein [Bacillus cereus]